MYPVTAFKKTVDKNPMKLVSEKYMIQLVEKLPSSSKKKSEKSNEQKTEKKQETLGDTTNIKKEREGQTYSFETHTDEQKNSTTTSQNYPFAFLMPCNEMFDQNNNFKGVAQHEENEGTFAVEHIERNNGGEMNQNIDFVEQTGLQVSPQFPLEGDEQMNDFIKIEQISEQLKRLHVYGEIFAENGYLVRSDARTKTDITRIEDALSSVTGLIGRKYAYKTDPTKVKCGFVAQEMQEVLPDLVQKDADGNLSVDYLGVVPYIVEALKTIHQNTLELQSNAKTEYNDLSKIVEDAVKKLQDVLEENGKETYVEKSTTQVVFSFEVFGPAIWILTTAILFSIFTIIVPFLLPELIILFCVMMTMTIVLWVAVIVKRKDLNGMFNKGRVKLKWRPVHFITWTVILSIIHISFIVQCILGYGGVIMSCVYTIVFLLVSGVIFLLSKFTKRWNFLWTLVFYSGFLVITIITTIVLVFVQPFIFMNVKDMARPYEVRVLQNTPITPIIFSSPPWNCFTPILYSDNKIPDNLSIVMPKTKYDPTEITPTVRGIVSTEMDTTTTSFLLKCSGIITVSYGEFTFKMCETKTTESSCLNNKCGWCRATQTCGYCSNGGEFCTYEGATGCTK
ncbi:hypothetical protein EIN_197840 [Entamoeba invadens IP1]|uniref:Peptidase S74 domain-containing protein n=1 Tax=Entamoeba invadens IP1 TaxID=370355 RepID=A0A0A1TZA1_ENTIV|nr:hypothetical protein EIN_197840 [Entamoeba invadens IP1]ELP83841.1 hypothetical protein EIN_197840 [Entamoeba invadens IP1]|eukprot:XP_004183187.1 hypothetical protein EIN_197840 [Entamoeba invadens IP1]